MVRACIAGLISQVSSQISKASVALTGRGQPAARRRISSLPKRICLCSEHRSARSSLGENCTDDSLCYSGHCESGTCAIERLCLSETAESVVAIFAWDPDIVGLTICFAIYPQGTQAKPTPSVDVVIVDRVILHS